MGGQAADVELHPEETSSEWLLLLLRGSQIVTRGRDEERLQIIATKCAARHEAGRQINLQEQVARGRMTCHAGRAPVCDPNTTVCVGRHSIRAAVDIFIESQPFALSA